MKRLILALAALSTLLLAPPAFADTKISAMSQGTAVQGTEKIPVVQGGANKYLTPEQLNTTVQPGYVVSRWYATGQAIAGGAAQVANQLKAYPFMVSRRVTVSDVGARVVTGVASSHVKVAFYAADASTFMPTGTPIGGGSCALDTSTSSTTPTCTLSATASLPLGINWVVTLSDNTAQLNGVNTAATAGVPYLIGNSSIGNLWPSSGSYNPGYVYSTGITYSGGFPDLTSVTWTEVGAAQNVPLIAFKVSSVP